MQDFRTYTSSKCLNEAVSYSYNPHQDEATVTNGKKTYTISIDSDYDVYSTETGERRNMEDRKKLTTAFLGIAKAEGKDLTEHFWRAVVHNLLPSDADKILKLCASEKTTCKKFLQSGEYKASYPNKLSMDSRMDDPDLEEILDSSNVYIINDGSELICITDRKNWGVDYDISKNKI